jgi:hypothetical protein
LADLPLVLAGPILRRVEPTLVTVWVATSQPRAVLLSIFEGRVQTGGGPGIFTFGDGELPRGFGAANTLRVGESLHVAVVYAETLPEQPFLPGINYSYNVGLGPFVATEAPGRSMFASLVRVEADLRSEGLLSDQPVGGRPHLPLGYDVGELPGFALPPPSITDLRLLHGSCRRPGKVYESGQGKKTFDGMAWVDDLILEWRRGRPGATALDPNVRPHQLFLTGDQIYADDVALAWLPMLNRLGGGLIGQTELLPTRYPPEADARSREAFLGVPTPKGFADLQAFVAAKTAEGKDPLEELKNDRRVRVRNDPCLDRLFGRLFVDPFQLEPGFQSDAAAPGVRFWPADLTHFPAGLRRPLLGCEAKLTSTDLHLVSFGEYCAMYLAAWSGAVWELEGEEPDLATIDEIYALPAGTLPQLWDLHACLPDQPTCLGRTDRTALDEGLERLRTSARRIQGIQNDHDTLGVFFQSLPRVRRALANIPTYMVFDDHDVTDDWNITRAWRDRVHTSPLGRSILTTSLVTYALFQDWGNDPKRYESGAWRKLLDEVTKLFPAGASSGPPVAVTEALATLFALNQLDPEKPAPELTWHFTVDGPAHRVVVLDTRTRRVFRSRHQPPGLLSPEALAAQLPDPDETPLPAGIEVVVVVSQTPALHPALATSVIMPLMTRITELKHHETFKNQTGIEPDNEIWPGDDLAFEGFVERLAKYGRVVVLSGEVHFGYAAQLSLWQKGIRRLALPDGVQADLDREILPPAARAAFEQAGLPLAADAFVTPRPGNGEWSIVDPEGRRTFLVREESGGELDDRGGVIVFEERGPARVAQFVSSGLKNAKDLIATLGRGLGFAFTLLDLTPVERMVWKEHFPAPLALPEGARLPLPVRGRLGRDPVLLPSGNWPAGTRAAQRPDVAWRLDVVRDERPDAERPEFVRPAGPPPEVDVDDLPGSYRRIAARHAAQLAKVRLTRGVVYQINLGQVRFERDGGVLVACQDLYSHPPGKHEAALIDVYRIPLERFDETRPGLRHDLAADGA